MPSTLTVYVKDSITKMPVAVAEVSVAIGDQKVCAGHTDRDQGSFTKSIDPQYVGQPLTCRVSKDGYEPQEVTREIVQDEVPLDVELVPIKQTIGPDETTVVDDNGSNKKWLKIAIGIGVLIVVAIIVYFMIPKSPKINYFKVKPESKRIISGDKINLYWETEYADKVILEPNLGKVPASADKDVTPEVTTTYRLSARKGDKEVGRSITVTVLLQIEGEWINDTYGSGSHESEKLKIESENSRLYLSGYPRQESNTPFDWLDRKKLTKTNGSYGVTWRQENLSCSAKLTLLESEGTLRSLSQCRRPNGSIIRARDTFSRRR